MAVDKNSLRDAVARARAQPPLTPSPKVWLTGRVVSIAAIALVGLGWLLGRMWHPGSEPAPPPSDTATPPDRTATGGPLKPPRVTDLATIRAVRDAAVTANFQSIESTLELASQTAEKGLIVASAIQSGHAFNFGAQPLIRNRRLARTLHDPVLESLNVWPPQQTETCAQLEQAFALDPLDVEVSGNLAICYVRTRDAGRAKIQAMYSLSLPRQGAGRTADWVTLGAAYAVAGNQTRAREALFVALANVEDPVKRCKSARYTMQNTFGPVLRQATDAMLVRIRELGLTDDPACMLPLD